MISLLLNLTNKQAVAKTTACLKLDFMQIALGYVLLDKTGIKR
jgi:hypothetical protein